MTQYLNSGLNPYEQRHQRAQEVTPTGLSGSRESAKGEPLLSGTRQSKFAPSQTALALNSGEQPGQRKSTSTGRGGVFARKSREFSSTGKRYTSVPRGLQPTAGKGPTPTGLVYSSHGGEAVEHLLHQRTQGPSNQRNQGQNDQLPSIGSSATAERRNSKGGVKPYPPIAQ